eukprot:11775400-Alexandrium_andersonii.AAC.1
MRVWMGVAAAMVAVAVKLGAALIPAPPRLERPSPILGRPWPAAMGTVPMTPRQGLAAPLMRRRPVGCPPAAGHPGRHRGTV